MKLYVEASEKEKFEFKLDIVVDLYPFEFIAGSTIRPVYLENGIVDPVALREYEDFVLEVLGLFGYYDFEILEEKYSNKSETSMYFTLYKKSESTENDIKCLFFIRISDHDYVKKTKEDEKKTRKHRNEFQEKEAQRLKQPKDKKHQRWKPKNIVVNGVEYGSYKEAIDDIDNMLKEL